MRKSLPGIIAFLLLFSFIFLSSCGSEDKVQQAPPEIAVIEVLQEDVPIHQEFVGQLYGIFDIPIRARVEGWLENLSFEEGRRVKKGQLLYEIDRQPLEARVAEALSVLAAAKTELVNAEAEYNRYKPLVEQNAVSQSDYDAALAAFDAAKATVTAAEANLDYAQIQLGYTSMYSPINGIIGKTRARVGEFVGREPNPVILNTVSRIDTMRVEFFLSEQTYLLIARYAASHGRNIHDPQNPRIREPNLELILSDGSLFEYKGLIAFIDREVDPSTGALLVQAIFPNPDGLLRPGQFARVKVKMAELEDAILVPQRCLSELQGIYSVTTVDAENKIVVKQVEVGPVYKDFQVIASGLEKGDRIVLEGIQKVKPGMTINPKLTNYESRYSGEINK
jgi:membrane fusion protein (multidrug efflux system)